MHRNTDYRPIGRYKRFVNKDGDFGNIALIKIGGYIWIGQSPV